MQTGVSSLADGISKLLGVTAGAPQIMANADAAQKQNELEMQQLTADIGYKNSGTDLNRQKYQFNQGYHDALPSIGPAVENYKTDANPSTLAAVVQAFMNANQGSQFSNIVPTMDKSMVQNQMIYNPDSLGEGGLARAMAVMGKPMYSNSTSGTLNTVTGETALTDLARSYISKNNAQATKSLRPTSVGSGSNTLANHILKSLETTATDNNGNPLTDLYGSPLNVLDRQSLIDLQTFFANNRDKFPTINDAYYMWMQQRNNAAQAQPAQPAGNDPILDVLHRSYGVR